MKMVWSLLISISIFSFENMGFVLITSHSTRYKIILKIGNIQVSIIPNVVGTDIQTTRKLAVSGRTLFI